MRISAFSATQTAPLFPTNKYLAFKQQYHKYNWNENEIDNKIKLPTETSEQLWRLEFRIKTKINVHFENKLKSLVYEIEII